MKKAIVSGANGFVGQALVRELLNNEYEVCAIVHNGNAKNLIPDPNLLIVNSVEEIRDQYDLFFNLAWSGTSLEGREDEIIQLKNIEKTLDFLKFAKKINCNRFISIGSIMEYEIIGTVYSEKRKPDPGYIYAEAKVATHMMSMSLASKLGIDIIWPVITNTYGPNEMSERLICSTIKKCLNGENPEFSIGDQNYDFVYIDDVARALRLIGEKGKPFSEYLIGSSNAKPLKEFLLEMKECIAPDLDFKFGEIHYSGSKLDISKYDCTKIEKDTGFVAEVSFEDGCRRTMDWLRNNL